MITHNQPILPSPIKISQEPMSLFVIYCTFQLGGLLSIVRTKTQPGNLPVVTLQPEVLNQNTALQANSMYSFIFPMFKTAAGTESFNIQYSADAMITKLAIVEMMQT